MASSIRENIQHVVQATLDGLNAWDYTMLASVRSEDFQFQVLPSSLGQKALNMAEYRGLWDNMLTPSFKTLKIKPLNQVFDIEQRKATVYTTIDITTAVGPFSYETIQLYAFNEEADKLVKLEEFFDSKIYLEIIDAMSGHEQAN